MTPYAVDLTAIRAAASRIAGIAHVTPVLTCTTLDRFKCMRGAAKAGDRPVAEAPHGNC